MKKMNLAEARSTRSWNKRKWRKIGRTSRYQLHVYKRIRNGTPTLTYPTNSVPIVRNPGFCSLCGQPYHWENEHYLRRTVPNDEISTRLFCLSETINRSSLNDYHVNTSVCFDSHMTGYANTWNMQVTHQFRLKGTKVARSELNSQSSLTCCSMIDD